MIVMIVITGIAAAALGSVYEATKAPIAMAQAAKQQNAIKAVVPEFDNQPLEEVKEYEVDGGVVKVFPATKDGKAVGYAIETFTNKGFNGLVKIMVGVDTDGNIITYSVLVNKETPGLGSKMNEWFLNKGDIRGMNPDKDNMTVSKDGGDVDAITAATISSRAFLDAINRGVMTLQANATDAYTSASTMQSDSTQTSKQTNYEER